MKKASNRKREREAQQDLRPEYRFDYRKARPNRFARSVSRNTTAVVLDPDVSQVFRTSEAVNSLLRSVISAMPAGEERERRRS